jgi:hypothetical protein
VIRSNNNYSAQVEEVRQKGKKMFKTSGTALRNQNCMPEEITIRLELNNACFLSGYDYLSSRLPPKTHRSQYLSCNIHWCSAGKPEEKPARKVQTHMGR